MTKLGIVRCLSECALGSGCIAGGVECAKAKSTIGSFKKENEDLKKKKKSINDAGKHYQDKNKILKDGISYAAQQLHLIATMPGDEAKMRTQARDAKGGLKQEKLEKKGIDTTFHRGT